jgi:nicotinamide-nucleotide amidase
MADAIALELAERLGEALRAARLRLVTAESCTGGGLGYLLTAIPGSSAWYERGFVTYSNEAKQELLGVPASVLAESGAVSEQAAAAMAAGALTGSRADISVAITGIAGPDGGTADKPVGTVCLAWNRRNGPAHGTRVLFSGSREQVREQAILMAVQGLLDLVGRGK